MFDDTRPIFLQLADRIADDVLRGVYAEEDQVPSTNELAAYLRINPATAGKGLNLLVERGVLYKRRGIGMFVAPGARSLIEDERHQAFARRYIVPMLAEAGALGIGTADVVRLIEQHDALPEAEPQPADTAQHPQPALRSADRAPTAAPATGHDTKETAS